MVKTRSKMRQVRHVRIRKYIKGTASKPRLAVFRSNKHIYAQLIDDTSGVTLASASSMEKSFKDSVSSEGAKKVGETLAKRAKDKKIQEVIFDRGGFKYHGMVASLADGAREGGLKF